VGRAAFHEEEDDALRFRFEMRLLRKERICYTSARGLFSRGHGRERQRSKATPGQAEEFAAGLEQGNVG
jgi:hypothetical protein